MENPLGVLREAKLHYRFVWLTCRIKYRVILHRLVTILVILLFIQLFPYIRMEANIWGLRYGMKHKIPVTISPSLVTIVSLYVECGHSRMQISHSNYCIPVEIPSIFRFHGVRGVRAPITILLPFLKLSLVHVIRPADTMQTWSAV